MNKYEAMFVFVGSASADALTKQMQTVQTTITECGGKITQVDEWGKRKLAYLVNKVAEGHYLLVYFESEPSAIDEMNKKYKFNTDIIKCMILSYDPLQDKQKEIKAAKEARAKFEEDERAVSESTPAAAPVAAASEATPVAAASEATPEAAPEAVSE
ncbi:MAG: small subunit ribosomal protein S6 [Candidatus Omnitrophota bacterium]|jgi:small subunit ribosomal protein S6